MSLSRNRAAAYMDRAHSDAVPARLSMCKRDMQRCVHTGSVHQATVVYQITDLRGELAMRAAL